MKIYSTAQPEQNRTQENEENNYVPFSAAIEKVELMHECFPKHLRMGTARMKEDKDHGTALQLEL